MGPKLRVARLVKRLPAMNEVLSSKLRIRYTEHGDSHLESQALGGRNERTLISKSLSTIRQVEVSMGS